MLAMLNHTDYVPPFYRLANQITLILGIAVLVFITVQGLVTIALVKQSLKHQVFEERHAIAQGAARSVEAFLRDEGDELAQSINIKSDTDTEAVDLATTLQHALDDNPEVLELVLVNNRGRMLGRVSRNSSSYFQPLSSIQQTAWFRGAQAGSAYASWLSSPAGNTIFISRPLDTSPYEGYVLVGYLDPTILSTILNRVELQNSEGIFMVNRAGHLIAYASSQPDRASRFSLPGALLVTEPPFTATYQRSPDQEIMGAGVAVSGSDWVVVSEVSQADALSGINRIELLLVALYAAWLIIILILGFMLTRRITIPLNNLILMVRRLEAGIYTMPVKAQTRSEIGILATAFNRLRRVIAERESALEAANRMLQSRSGDLENLSRQTIAVEEEERRRVSRELHDSLGQILAALKMNLDVAERLDDPQRVSELLREASQITIQAMDEVHRISQNLRPTILDDLGLKAAVEWHVDQFCQHFELEVIHDFAALEGVELSVEASITAYRFLQEALNNIQKHAEATRVTIKTQQQGSHLMIGIRDNGKGFDPQQQKHLSEHLPLGLTGLEERLMLVGGKLVIHSLLGEGTTLVAILPLQK
jgi:signal transduction histidine kinase